MLQSSDSMTCSFTDIYPGQLRSAVYFVRRRQIAYNRVSSGNRDRPSRVHASDGDTVCRPDKMR